MNPLLPIEYIVVALAALLLIGGAVAWRTKRRCRPALRRTLLALRALTALGLALLALNPGHWMTETTREERCWAVLLDRSASMATADVAGRTRWAEACRLAGRALAAEPEHTRAHFYPFDATLGERVEPEALEGLRPEGAFTDPLRAGQALLDRYAAGDRRLAGVLLLSDGRRLGGDETRGLTLRALAQKTPFFVIPLGGDVPRRDLEVRAPRAHLVAYSGQPLRLRVRVTNAHLGPIEPTVKLTDSTGRTLAERAVAVADQSTADVEFETTPTQTGYGEYQVMVPRWEGEGDDANNTAHIGVSVLAGRLRVLLVEGTPYWDSKFLGQLLRRQANMAVTAVYRLSAEKYFKIETEETLVSSATESAFPADAEGLGQYDLVVFGKGVEYFLTPRAIEGLKEFVRERGGGVVFARGKPYAGEFPALEALEPLTWGQPVSVPFRWRPTAEGEAVGLFGQRLPAADDPLWGRLPPLTSAVLSRGLNAFADVLVEGDYEGSDGRHAIPVVLSSRYGRGLIVTVNADGLWQWDFFAASDAQTVYEEFWTQLLTWAATYGEFLPGQAFALRLSASSAVPGEAVRARVARRPNAPAATEPTVRVLRGGETVQTPALTATGPGRWDSMLTLQAPGAYRVAVDDGVARDAWPVCAALRVDPPPAETDELSADPAWLQTLAEQTGGRVIGEADLAATVAGFTAAPPAEAGVGEAVWVPWWDRPWVLALLLLPLAAEWFLRRRHGLL